METIPFILKEFKPFSLETTIEEVKSFFNETTFTHFPVVENKQLIGLISENNVVGIYENEKELGYFQYLFHVFFMEETNSLIEIITISGTHRTNIIPVVTEAKEYLGYYDLIDVLNVYNETPFLKNEGTVLLLEKEVQKISFSEICQIVETNKGKVLGLFISESTPTSFKITLKFSSPDVNEIIQSFRRYEYQILSKHKEDFYLEELKDRSEYLQKYLNI
jgi:CBS domain-containing protein